MVAWTSFLANPRARKKIPLRPNPIPEKILRIVVHDSGVFNLIISARKPPVNSNKKDDELGCWTTKGI